MKLLVRLGIVALVLTLAFQGCRHPENLKPRKGNLTLALHSRTHAWSTEAGHQAAPGTLEASYAGHESSVEVTRNLARSFVGGFSIPVSWDSQGIPMELNRLVIKGEDDQILFKIDEAQLPSLVQQASYTSIVMNVLITEDGSAFPKIQFKRTPPQAFFPYPLLKQAFIDPVAIASTRDIDLTLSTLREIATPTTDFHEALLRVITEAPYLDLAHLQMLLDACYIDAAQVESAQAEIARSNAPEAAPGQAAGRAVSDEAAPSGDSDVFEDEQYLEAHENLVKESLPLQPLINRMILVGLSKVTDLKSPEQAQAVLSRLFPAKNLTRTFQIAEQRLGDLPQEKRQELLALAKAKDPSY